MQVYRARSKRSIVWDYKGEHEGEPINSREDLPNLFTRPAFTAVYQAPRWATPRTFDAFCHVLLSIGQDFLFCIDEASAICDGYKEGGLGQMLRFSRDQHIDIIWTSQKPTRIPSVYLTEVNTLHVFHLHGKHDLIALSGVLSPEEMLRVAALPPHDYLTVNL